MLSGPLPGRRPVARASGVRRQPAGADRPGRRPAPDAADRARAGRPRSRSSGSRPTATPPQRYAGASLDFTPFHLDAELARAIGLPGIILHGLYTYGQLAHGLLEPFGGDPRVLRSLAARFRRPAVPEQELTVAGVVTAADGRRLEVACAVEQGGREVVSEGEAVLELPEK